jgi:hypothetical protein
MPERPGRAFTRETTRCVRLPSFGSAARARFGRSKLATWTDGFVRLQLGEDVIPRAGIGRRGDGKARHAGEEILQAAKRAVIGPEVMPPLADTVRLVHRDDGDVHFRQPVREARAERFG